MTTMQRLEVWHLVAAGVVWAGCFALVVRGCLRDAKASDAIADEEAARLDGVVDFVVADGRFCGAYQCPGCERLLTDNDLREHARTCDTLHVVMAEIRQERETPTTGSSR